MSASQIRARADRRGLAAAGGHHRGAQRHRPRTRPRGGGGQRRPALRGRRGRRVPARRTGRPAARARRRRRRHVVRRPRPGAAAAVRRGDGDGPPGRRGPEGRPRRGPAALRRPGEAHRPRAAHPAYLRLRPAHGRAQRRGVRRGPAARPAQRPRRPARSPDRPGQPPPAARVRRGRAAPARDLRARGHRPRPVPRGERDARPPRRRPVAGRGGAPAVPGGRTGRSGGPPRWRRVRGPAGRPARRPPRPSSVPGNCWPPSTRRWTWAACGYGSRPAPGSRWPTAARPTVARTDGTVGRRRRHGRAAAARRRGDVPGQTGRAAHRPVRAGAGHRRRRGRSCSAATCPARSPSGSSRWRSSPSSTSPPAR